jgi:hypothetical protein
MSFFNQVLKHDKEDIQLMTISHAMRGSHEIVEEAVEKYEKGEITEQEYVQYLKEAKKQISAEIKMMKQALKEAKQKEASGCSGVSNELEPI